MCSVGGAERILEMPISSPAPSRVIHAAQITAAVWPTTLSFKSWKCKNMAVFNTFNAKQTVCPVPNTRHWLLSWASMLKQIVLVWCFIILLHFHLEWNVCRWVSFSTERSQSTSGLSGTIRQHRTWLKRPRTSAVRRAERRTPPKPSEWPGMATRRSHFQSYSKQMYKPPSLSLSVSLTVLSEKVSLYAHSTLSLISTTSRDNVKCEE